jgi:dTDP-4-amino-4,6-dideoxygalactose transaminase
VKVLFNSKYKAGKELRYLQDCIENKNEQYFYNRYATQLIGLHSSDANRLLVSSCTHGLEVITRLLEFTCEDEIIVPSYAFISSAAAFTLGKSRIIFCDSRLDTATICLNHLKTIVTKKTRAVCIVNYNGYGEDLEAISKYCDSREILLIEDNAHGFGVFNKGKALGTFGFASSTSFDHQKNISCGQGGVLYLKNKFLLDDAHDISNFGANMSEFTSGRASRYSWSRLGSNYLLSEFSAAILCAQLEEFQSIQNRRKFLWLNYWKSLSTWSTETSVTLPPVGLENSYHIFWILLPSNLYAIRFIDHMKNYSVQVLPHYSALHLSSMSRKWQQLCSFECPTAERLSSTLVRLPLNNSLSAEKQNIVIEAALRFS